MAQNNLKSLRQDHTTPTCLPSVAAASQLQPCDGGVGITSSSHRAGALDLPALLAPTGQAAWLGITLMVPEGRLNISKSYKGCVPRTPVCLEAHHQSISRDSSFEDLAAGQDPCNAVGHVHQLETAHRLISNNAPPRTLHCQPLLNSRQTC